MPILKISHLKRALAIAETRALPPFEVKNDQGDLKKADHKRKLRRPKKQSFYTVQYDGGDNIAVIGTRVRTMTVSRVPVTPDNTCWSVTVEAWRLNRAVFYHDSDTREMFLVNDKYLALRYPEHAPRSWYSSDHDPKKLYIAIPLHGSSAELLELPPIDETQPHGRVPTLALREALVFLSRGAVNEDLEDRTETCTLFRDGHGMCTDNLAELVTAGPQLPFELSVRKKDAKRVVLWLKTLHEKIGKEADNVEVRELRDGEQIQYCFRDVSGSYSIWVVGATQPFLRQAIDGPRSVAPRLIGRISRRSLFGRAIVCAHRAYWGRMVCQFQADTSGRWHLNIHAKTDTGSPEIEDSIPLQMVQDTANIEESYGQFEIGGESLAAALKHFPKGKKKEDEVLLFYRPDVQRLSIRDLTENSPEATGPEAFLRIAVSNAGNRIATTLAGVDRHASLHTKPSSMPSAPGPETVSGSTQNASEMVVTATSQAAPTKIEGATAVDDAETASEKRDRECETSQNNPMTITTHTTPEPPRT